MRWRTPIVREATPARVRVPCLVGSGVRAAQDAAIDAGLLPVLRQRMRGFARCGRVVAQVPGSGSWAAVGSRVWIWIEPEPGQPGRDDPEGPDDGGGGGSWLPRPPGPRLPAGTK